MEQVKNISDRLKEFAKTQRISIREFERKCGLGNSFVNHIGQSLGVDKLENILQVFPTLNKDWILYGSGEMILNEVAEDMKADFQSNFNKVCSLIQKKDEQMDRLISLLEKEKEDRIDQVAG
jgi:hypothetical protein